MRTILLAGLLAYRAFAGDCFPLAGDRILGRDLALANPAFAALPANLTVSYAPAPGQKRVFAQAELIRIARANRIELSTAAEVCFALPLREMQAAEVLAAMRVALPPEAELTIIELSRGSIPLGALEFPTTGMEPAVQGVRMWRGSVRYGQTLRMPVWARVDLRYRVEAVVASTDLRPSIPIAGRVLKIEMVDAPVDRLQQVARRVEEVAGRIPKRTIAAGSAIPLALLDAAPAVRRGDAVKVEVRSGPATIQIDAVAEAPARNGDLVELRNPTSGKKFFARLESDSRAVIVIGGAL